MYQWKITDVTHSPEVAIHLGVQVDKRCNSLSFEGELHKWNNKCEWMRDREQFAVRSLQVVRIMPLPFRRQQHLSQYKHNWEFEVCVPFQLTEATLSLMALSEMEMFGGDKATLARDVGKKVFSHSTVEDPVRLAVRWRKHPVGPASQILNTTLVLSDQTRLEESIGKSTLGCPKPIFTAPCQCMEQGTHETLSPRTRPSVFSTIQHTHIYTWHQ